VKDREVDPFRFGYRLERRTDEAGKEVTVQVPMAYEALLHPEEIDFPWQDWHHSEICNYLMTALRVVLRGEDDSVGLCRYRVDWGVAGVKPHKPDVTLFRGVVGKRNRMCETFEAARWGARPAFVLEVASADTRSIDLDDKVAEYHRAGIPFYFIVDACPEGQERRVELVGYRHAPERYARLEPDADGRVWMEPVKLWLAAEGDSVRCFDERNKPILSVLEMHEAIERNKAAYQELRRKAEEAISLNPSSSARQQPER
jgi:Uma2 family endonuclease